MSIKKKFAVRPSLYAACIELAKGNAAAGGLLCQIALLTENRTLKDEKGSTGWLALSSLQWKVLTGFTRHQHDNALKYLRSSCLIDYRRRKLKYKDKFALIWIRLSDQTKSGIEEILSRDPVPAFAEMGSMCVSVPAELGAPLISGGSEFLDKNVITKKENNLKNVICEETKKESTYQSQKQEEEGKSKRKQYKAMMAEIYKECPHLSYEPFKESAALILNEAKDYIESNPGKFLDACPEGKRSYSYVLGKIFREWEVFGSFVVYFYNGYNIPQIPQLWSLRHHLKSIPDFMTFLNMRENFEEALKKSNLPVNKDLTAWCDDFAEYIQYRKLSLEAKSKFLQSKVEEIANPFKKLTAADLKMHMLMKGIDGGGNT